MTTTKRGLALLAPLLWATTAYAGATELPAVKVSAANPVPACATPGRLMAYLTSRQPKADARFGEIASLYKRQGEAFEVRWDYAFFQMMLETGSLSFGSDSRHPNVRAQQNNFAGIGAVDNEAGESFPDVATGVRAHLEHLMLYAGLKVDSPVAERTRKVQEWNILAKWQKPLKGPIGFRQVADHWAPGKAYGDSVAELGKQFYDDYCNKPDPNPETVAAAPVTKPDATAHPNGKKLAQDAIQRAREAGETERSGLGAPMAEPVAGAKTPAVGSTPFPLVNAPPAASPEPGKPAASAPVTVASAGGAAKAAKPGPAAAETPAAAAPGTCKVWTASYGGHKAVIIKARGAASTNYTVLDVNEGTEKRETEAYIAAYAKGGQLVGEFASEGQALEKAFEMCPEG